MSSVQCACCERAANRTQPVQQNNSNKLINNNIGHRCSTDWQSVDSVTMLYAWLSAASVMSAAAGRNDCRLKATAV
jgi:hypothetical protein